MSETHDGAPEGVSEDTTAADLATDDTATDQSGDDGAAAAEGEQSKPKPTAQDRIDELTRKRRDAEREAEFWKAKATGGDKPAEPKTDPPKEDAEPDPADFTYGETDPGFIRALARFEGRKAYRDEAEKDRRATQVRTVAEAWDERQQSFAKDTPDYFEVLDKDWACSAPMADAIRTSETGAAVAYHLAKNPDEARRIAALIPLAAVREIGRLEARLDKSAGPPPKTASDAPPPPTPLRGNGGRFAVPPDTDDFAAFEKQFK